MKQSEFKKCACCGNGVMHNGCLIFYRVRLERMVIDLPAVERQHGLEMMLGRNAALAAVMGPNEDLAKSLGGPITVLVCQDCSNNYHVADIAELPEEGEQGK